MTLKSPADVPGTTGPHSFSRAVACATGSSTGLLKIMQVPCSNSTHDLPSPTMILGHISTRRSSISLLLGILGSIRVRPAQVMAALARIVPCRERATLVRADDERVLAEGRVALPQLLGRHAG